MLRLLTPGVRVRPGQLVAGLLAATVSRAPSCGLVMVAVAEARLGLSASTTVMPESMTTGPPSSVKAVEPAGGATIGASFAAVTLTFLVAGVLLAAPSLATNEITRVVVLGVLEASLKVTDRRQVW